MRAEMAEKSGGGVPEYIRAHVERHERLKAERREIEARNEKRNLMPLDPAASEPGRGDVVGYGWMARRGD